MSLPSTALALLLSDARGWEMRTVDGVTSAHHKASGLRLSAWGAAGVGVSLWGREGERIGACYHHHEDGLAEALATVIDPIIAALTAARDAIPAGVQP